MKSQLTIRLTDDLEGEVARQARRLNLKRSDIVRLALRQYFDLAGAAEERTPYERVKRIVGSVESGIPDLGERHREHILKRLRARAQDPA